ncbi:MAG: hypothetical protein ACLTCP_05875 [Ruminococcus bicirculans (ex Wegman et al. 2014)]
MRAYKTVKNTGIAVSQIAASSTRSTQRIKYPLAKDFVCRQKSFSTAWT